MNMPFKFQDRLSELIFAGEGEMATLMRSHNWADSPLGPIKTWSASLKTAVRIILGSRYPMFIWWGPAFINLYNDAYSPILGQRHPEALGQSAREVWADVWDVVGPQAESALQEGQSSWNQELLMLMERNGYLEETYFTFSYSPITEDSGETSGVFCAVTEETERVLANRRLRTLRELGAEAAQAETTEAACQISTAVLANNSKDIPFALIYLLDRDHHQARLISTTHLAIGTPISPRAIELADQAADCWSLNSILVTGTGQVMEQLIERFGSLPGGAWNVSPNRAMILPLKRLGQETLGFLIAGISPYRSLDDDYRGFFDLVAGQVTTAITNTLAYEEEHKRAEAFVELDRVKTIFFNNISHEFRTPLTLMLGPAEDALTDQTHPLSADQRQRIEIIQRNGLRLLKLVNTLLDFSQIESNRIQAVYEPTDLASFTAELASVFRSAIEQANLRLIVDCPPLPEPIYVDREMWEKIVLNLLSNAFKFTFEGEIRVSLKAVQRSQIGCEQGGWGQRPHAGVSPLHPVQISERIAVDDFGLPILDFGLENSEASTTSPPDPEPNNPNNPKSKIQNPKFVVLEVQDTGTGIPAAEIPRLFERFYRVKGAKGRTFEGSGIGLSLVQELVNLHGGTIQVSSVEGEGSCFRVAIPIGSDHLPQEQIGTAPSLAPTPRGVTPYVEEARQWIAAEGPRSPIVALRSRHTNPELQRSFLIVERGAGVQPLRGGSAPTPLVHNQFVNAVVNPELVNNYANEQPNPLKSKIQNPKSKILLVDDNPDMRSYLKRLLSQRWQVETATNGAIALDLIRQQLPDLVLTDVMMPEVDGFELLQALRADPNTKSIPIILLSARAGEAATIAGLEAGANDYLFKPFSAHELVARVETQLQMSQLRQEQSANRFKNEFLMTVTHELQAPLAAILGWARLLQSQPFEPDRVARALATIERNAVVEAKLVRDLLDVSGLLAGKLRLKTQLVDLVPLVQDVIRTFHAAAEAKSIQLIELIETIDNTDSFPVLADGDRLRQIITNLLDNAIKFTPEGGQVTLCLERLDSQIQITVTDTGIGIPADFLLSVFDRFTQAEVPSRYSPGGVGIGLTIARYLVELHRGTIEVASEGEGQGTTFTVKLPLV